MTITRASGNSMTPLQKARMWMIISIAAFLMLVLAIPGLYYWAKYHSSADQYGDPSPFMGTTLSIALGLLIMFDVAVVACCIYPVAISVSKYFEERSKIKKQYLQS